MARSGAISGCHSQSSVRDNRDVFEGVLLIGGGASAGKTTAALSIARQLAVGPLVHLDDVRREDPRVVHRLGDTSVWDREPAELLQLLLEETASLHGVVAQLVAALRPNDGGAIVEGEGVEPELVSRLNDAPVRCAYVIETDPVVLSRTFAARGPAARFLALSSGQQQAAVEMNRLYSIWLRDEAEKRGHAWVPSQPWATLPERILRAAAIW